MYAAAHTNMDGETTVEDVYSTLDRAKEACQEYFDNYYVVHYEAKPSKIEWTDYDDYSLGECDYDNARMFSILKFEVDAPIDW